MTQGVPLVVTEYWLLNMVRVSRGGVKRVKNNPKMVVDGSKRGSVIKMCGVYRGPGE